MWLLSFLHKNGLRQVVLFRYCIYDESFPKLSAKTFQEFKNSIQKQFLKCFFLIDSLSRAVFVGVYLRFEQL